MPKFGKRKKLISNLEKIYLFKLVKHIIEPPAREVVHELINEYLLFSEVVNQCRYASDRTQIQKTTEWTNILSSLRVKK